MNAIQYALAEIKSQIPKMILDKVFLPRRQYGNRLDPHMPASADNMIIEKVINDKVRRDCDTSGAFEIDIPLAGIQPERIAQDMYVIHIPKQLTQGRDITVALSLIWFSMGAMGYANSAMMGSSGYARPICNNPIATNTNAMMTSTSPMDNTETTNVRVVGDNTIFVQSLMYPNQNSYLKCIVSHDTTFSSLPPPAHRAFGKLCVLACKQYIYTNYIIDMDSAELVGGRELGKFKEIIEGYADAGDLYDEYFETKFRKVQFQSDHTRYNRLLKGKIGRYFG